MTVRRQLLLVLVGSALAAPLTVLAQPPSRAKRIGFLWDADSPGELRLIDAFRAGLRELGYVQDRDYVIEQRSAKGNHHLLPALAAELLALKVDLIVATSNPSAMATRGATRDVPIVSIGDPDPVGSGLVASLRRPGGNVTGLSSQTPELVIKHLDLLRQIVPNLRRVGFLYPADNTAVVAIFARLESECGKLQIQCIRAAVRQEQDIPGAFGVLQRGKAQALIVSTSTVISAWRDTVIDHAARHRLPAIYGPSVIVEAGGLISYASSGLARFRRAAVYADKIFKGAKPGDLPIEQPTKFDLVVNMKTAKALGITIPQSILVRADRVIE
ncbi:MAG TPA: ABC transporter substrate-binding protein [Burkholderiales bacterium]|nr:ABC transporter substrate-binding protein [Burkholderiales bacterium]